MSSGLVSRLRDNLVLAADGCLITAGTFALMMGAAFGLDALGVAPLAEPHGGGTELLLSTVSWLLQVGGFVVGPAVVWLVYRRRFTWVSLLGAAGGLLVGAATVMVAAMLGALIEWSVGLVVTTPYVGAIAYLVLVVVAFAAILLWLDANAVRDLAAPSREHALRDVARLAATATVLAFAWGVVAAIRAGEGPDAAAFLLAAGVQGAVVVTAADLAVRVFGNRTSSSPVIHT